jgi:hypothetical protein
LRYKEQLQPSTQNFLQSVRCYQFGSRIAPWNGSANKSESIIPNMHSDVFSVVFFLSRSMCTENPYDAHETLLMIFNKERSASEAMG